MKHDLKFLSAVIVALGLPLVADADSKLTQAQITQIIKDVQTIDPGKGARQAVMRETLQGEQSLRTGIESRAELLFNDHTITRLGANTHFSFTEGTRNMSLQSGVMLLQVPKGIGGAKIETAAVTAAVTGTTIMVEAGKDYTKLIVLEGECCLWPKDDKKDKNLFKFKHKTCAVAGQEIILRNGAKTIPDPVYVNLKVLEGSSLLITGDWHAPLNDGPIQGAADDQGPGTYIPTNLAIIGAGTDVTVIQDQGGNPPPGAPPGGTPPPVVPPGKYGPLGTIPGGSFIIGGGSTINTDPKIVNGSTTSYGRIYRGTILDGPPVPYLFGAGTTVNFPTLHVDSDFPNYGVAAFKFTNLSIQGTPNFQISGNSPTQVGLVSEGFINVDNASQTTLDFSQLDELSLFTAGGYINIGANITLNGPNRLQLYSYGAGHNITMDGEADLGEKFLAVTQGDYSQNGSVYANEVMVLSGGAITFNGYASAEDIDLEAGAAFGGDGYLSAFSVNLQGAGLMTLDEVQGEGNTDTVNGVQLDMDSLYSLSITGNGINLPDGFTGEPFDAEGAQVDLTLTSFNQGEALSGTIHLAGNILVDNLSATADSDITDDANITSNYSADLTSNYGDVNVTGNINASEITLSGYNITTGAYSNLDTGNDSDDASINITSNGESTATLDGYFNTKTMNIAGNDIIINSSVEEEEGQQDGLNASDTINIDATGSVTINGFINTPNLNIGGVFEDAVPTKVTLASSGEIDADYIQINAGIVEVEGNVYSSYYNDAYSTAFFGVDTTSSNVELFDNAGSMQDFYSLNGGGIDAQTIQVNSRGDLILDQPPIGGFFVKAEYIFNPTAVNGVYVDPYYDLTELDLTGNTIEVLEGYQNSPSTLNLTTTGGDITVGGDIYLGTDYNTASSLTLDSAGDIIIVNPDAGSLFRKAGVISENTSPVTFTADTISLTGGRVTTSDAGLILNAGNVTLNLSNVAGDLSQPDSGGAPGTFLFNEYTTGDEPAFLGSITTNFDGSDPVLAVSANSLTVGDLDFSSFDSFSLSLTSANDINGGVEPPTATIYGATSVALQVGVAATLAGDTCSYISYNGSQLLVDVSYLDSFSVTAPSITVNSGFPQFYTATDLNLEATTGDVVANTGLLTDGSITVTSDSGSITVNGDVASFTDATFLAANSITVTGGVYVGQTDPVAGSVKFTATSGDINLGGDVYAFDGGISLTANDGNITVGNGESTISSSGDFYLSAGGTATINNDVSLNGALTVHGGSGVRTANESTFSGATSVDLSMDIPAAISESFGDDNLLVYGAAADSPDNRIAIDLSNSSLDYSYINAQGSSITLTGEFDMSATDLTLEASNGAATVTGAGTVYARIFTLYSYSGNIVIGEAVSVSTFDAEASNGNLIINDEVDAQNFHGQATGVGPTHSITGSGSVFSSDISLYQSAPATISQTGQNQFTYNGTLQLHVTPTEGESYLTLDAQPTTLGTDINLNGGLWLGGGVNAQGHTVTADDVTLSDLGTATTGPGNATSLTVFGRDSITLDYFSMDGAGATAGAGGTLNATATNGEESYITINDYNSANGGSSGGNGGTFNLTAASNINAGDGASVHADGGAGSGNGGAVNLTAQGGSIASLEITANGGNANPTGSAAGGNGGTVHLSSGNDLDFYGTISANGGDARANSGAAGGNGGTITLDSDGSISVNNSITALSGVNGNTKWTGGNGGTVNLTAAGEVTINSLIGVSASDLYTNRVSAKGGNINVTSHAATGVAINITNSGQLASILNQAAAGPGGKITFIADSGGSVAVSGSVRADHGTIDIRNTAASGALVALDGATLTGDVVKVGALGSNGTLTIGGNTSINGDTLISLYAAGDSGSVVFTGNTYLSGAGLKTIAGSTVTINNGVNVNVTGGAATVYTNNPNYTGSGGNGSTTGQFTGNPNTTTKPFASKPAF